MPTRIVTLEVGGLPADAGVVDALARLQLNARRMDMGIRLRHASPELLELLSLVGLRDVLDVEAGGAGRGAWAAAWAAGRKATGVMDALMERPRRNE